MSARAGFRAALAAALAALLALGGAEVEAATPGPAPTREDELRWLQQRLDLQRDRLQRTRQREDRLAAEIYRLDRQREREEVELRRLGANLRRARQRAEAAAAALARAEAALARRRTLLASRLVDIHRFGRAGYLDVVLGATSFSEFVARARLVGAIIREDGRLIAAYTDDRNRTAALREDLEAQQVRLGALMREAEARQRVLDERVQAKRELLDRVVRERALAEQAVREMEEDQAALEPLIQRLQPSAVPKPQVGAAAFVWPLRGPITSRFGVRRHPFFRRRHFHAGVDISAPRGTPVPAAAAGTVIFTGWYGGYGKLVILDHGSGISTLYGHLSAITVSVGQRVTRRQIIGRVGSTGYSTGPHLHYEIRRNGRPINPLR